MTSAPTTYFAGRAWKRSLPVFDGPPGPDAPSLKRLMLPQGELAQLYDDEQGLQYLAFIELKSGSVRGNHFHQLKQEFVYILDGEALLDLEDIQSKMRETVPMRTGDLALIQPGIAHALRVIRAGHAVEFSPSRFNPADIHRYPLTGQAS